MLLCGDRRSGDGRFICALQHIFLFGGWRRDEHPLRLLPPGVGATYDYFINDSLHVTGRVGGYQEKESEIQYQLDGFFNKGKANAVLRIVDLPDADNIKAAVLYYANKEEDPAQTYYQYILMTEM